MWLRIALVGMSGGRLLQPTLAETAAETRNETVPCAPCFAPRPTAIRFGGLTALNKVNVEIKRGEIRAIIGPNGAGKSTFFNCVTGVLRARRPAAVLFNGADVTGLLARPHFAAPASARS